MTTTEKTLHDFTLQGIDGKPMPLSQFKGKAVLLVNTASECGYTGQYEGLEQLWLVNRDKGLVVVGVPSNDFGGQEPGTDKEIAEFCTESYGVTFPMFSKVSVKGDDITPLYKHLITQEQAKTKETGDVAWNFEKFLIGKDGKLVGRYRSRTAPDSADLVAAIEGELAK